MVLTNPRCHNGSTDLQNVFILPTYVRANIVQRESKKMDVSF